MACILVCGVPRSGTSLVSATCSALGVYMGEGLDRGSHWAKYGVHEDIFFRSYHLGMTDFATFTPRPNPRPDKLAYHTAEVKKREAQHAIWGIKNIALSLHTDKITPYAECKLITTDRDVIASQLSLEDKLRFDPEYTAAHIKRCRAALDALRSQWTLPHLQITWQDLQDHNADTVKRIADFVNLPVTDAALGLVDAEWNHFGGSTYV